MKKTKRKQLLAASLALIMTMGIAGGSSVFAAPKSPEIVQTVQNMVPVDLDSFTEPLAIDYSALQMQPLTGWFTETVSEGRSIKVYIPEDTQLRGRFNVVAIPDGKDAWDFLNEEGWIEKAETKNEAIFVLEPGEGGWGTVEEEKEYVKAGMAVLTSAKNHNKIGIFNTFGTFAVVGYEKACGPLEAWVMENPLHVYAQVYVNGESAGEASMEAARNYVYDENFPGSRKLTAEQFDYAMESMGLTRADAATKADTPIPTWFVNYDEKDPSIEFWKDANDVLPGKDMDGTYHQSIDSKAWQTIYANKNIKSWNPDTKIGLSEVRVTDTADTDEIFDFVSSFTNYTAVCSYSNNLASRMDYMDAVDAVIQETKKDVRVKSSYVNFEGKDADAELMALKSTRVSYDYNDVEGTMYAGALATKDYDDDGDQDPRLFLVYIPDSAKEKFGKDGAPLVLVNPGNQQTAMIFMDCSGWVPVANDEGCVVVIINQPYSSPVSVGYEQVALAYTGDGSDTSNYSRGVMSVMENTFDGKYVDIDFSRVYVSGHSAGSNAAQHMGLTTDSDWIAAVGSTSFSTRCREMSEGYMPIYFMVGQTDISDYRVDMNNDPYVSKPITEGADTMYEWLSMVLTKNKMETFAPDDEEVFLNSCSKVEKGNTRYVTYTWANDQGIELVKFGRTLLREHNCFPEEFRLAWNYMEHFNVVENKDGSISRFYSPSAFEKDDAIEIGRKEKVDQNISCIKSCTKAYGDKAFSLKASTDGDGRLTYKSSKPSVASVDKNGKVTIKGTGKTVLTISAHSTENCNLTVKKITLTVVPQKAAISSVTAGTKSMKVVLKKDTKASGYQVTYADNKNFKSSKNVTLNKKSLTKTTVSGLKAGKTYYVKARAYKVIDGKKVYGAYSAVKTAKIKK